jgi:hypothetical protein
MFLHERFNRNQCFNNLTDRLSKTTSFAFHYNYFWKMERPSRPDLLGRMVSLPAGRQVPSGQKQIKFSDEKKQGSITHAFSNMLPFP